MSRARKTIRQQLTYRPEIAEWLKATQALFNQAVAFYYEVIEAHPEMLELDSKAALTAIERLTHRTKKNPAPILSDASVAGNLPALFRRAALQAALGAARSFHSSLARWRVEKEQALSKGKKFKKRAPAPPGHWNTAATFYAGMWKRRTSNSILLKVWTGASWCWVKFQVAGQKLPAEWEAESPQLVRHGKGWWLHTHIEKFIPNPGTVEEQVTSTPDIRVCAVKLDAGDALAVCTIQTREGTTIATRFIRGGRRLNGLRKSLLGRIARRRADTGLIARGKLDNTHLWIRVRHLDEQAAHLVSRRIGEFARSHGATILVFEHLPPFHPGKGKYSRRSNELRAYWLRSKIVRYTQYKAWAEGIVTCQVSPRHNSRECARCHAEIARYGEGQPASGYTPGAPLMVCAACGMRGNAGRNASLKIGQKLFARYEQEEKPRTTPRAGRLSKERGDSFPQAAESGARPHAKPARHGERDGHGTAQG